MKILVQIVFFFTCLYFLGAGNLTFLAKSNKTAATELFDLDDDAPDEEGKEAKDCKEDGCDEEIFVDLIHSSLLPKSIQLSEIRFCDLQFFLPGNVIDITAPPPRA